MGFNAKNVGGRGVLMLKEDGWERRALMLKEVRGGGD